MSQRRVIVGTSPVILANHNAQRSSISVTYVPSIVETGNTGTLFIGKGFPPSAVLGNPNQGDPVKQSSVFSISSNIPDRSDVFRGQIWAVSDTAGQVVIVDEENVIHA